MPVEERDRIESFSDVKARVEDMKYFEEERLHVFYLSSGNEVLREEDFNSGIDSVNIDFRRVFRQAISSGASAVVIVHNHPSGKSDPTPQDIEVTEQLIEAGKKPGVKVLDHVIVGKTPSSMKASEAAEITF